MKDKRKKHKRWMNKEFKTLDKRCNYRRTDFEAALAHLSINVY